MWRDLRRFGRDVLCTLCLGLFVLTCFLWWRSHRVSDAAILVHSREAWWPVAIASDPGWIDLQFHSEERIDHAGEVVEGIIYEYGEYLDYDLHHSENPGSDFDAVAAELRQQMSGRRGPPRFGVAVTRDVLIRSNPSPSWPTRVVESRLAVRYWFLAIFLAALPTSVLIRGVCFRRWHSRGTSAPVGSLAAFRSALARSARSFALALFLAIVVLWGRSLFVADEFNRGRSGIVALSDGRSHWESVGDYAELCGGVLTIGHVAETRPDLPGPDYIFVSRGTRYNYGGADTHLRNAAVQPPEKARIDAWGFRVTHAVAMNAPKYYYGSAVTPVKYTVDASGWRARVPLWLPTLVLAAVPVSMLVRRRRRNRAMKRTVAGLCPSCGYDLRESTGRCPECGAEQPRTEDAAGEREPALAAGGSPAAT